MSDEGWKALAIILPSFFGLVAAIVGAVGVWLTVKGNKKVDEVHRVVNGASIIRYAEAEEVGKLKEKEAQHIRDEEKK